MNLRIWDDCQFNSTRIAIILEGDVKRVFNPITQEVKEIKMGEQIPDDFIIKIPTDMKQEFIDSLTEQFSKSGNPPSKEARNAGNLEATKYHLEDMRRIALKLKD